MKKMVFGFMVQSTNPQELRGLVKEIFKDNCYYFETDNRQPVIVDIGAHVGLASLYFKKLYPESVVLAVEPVPQLAQAFRQNMEANRITGVSLLQVAVVASSSDEWNAGSASFYLDQDSSKWLSTSSLEPDAWDGTVQQQEIRVPVTTLEKLIDYPVDLLKMDIEGAELAVLSSKPEVLNRVKQIMVEYHPRGKNQLPQLVGLLSKLGFSVSLYKNSKAVSLEWARGLVLVEGKRG